MRQTESAINATQYYLGHREISMQATADKFGVSRNAVRKRLIIIEERTGHKVRRKPEGRFRKYSRKEFEQAIKMYKEGKSINKIKAIYPHVPREFLRRTLVDEGLIREKSLAIKLGLRERKKGFRKKMEKAEEYIPPPRIKLDGLNVFPQQD